MELAEIENSKKIIVLINIVSNEKSKENINGAYINRFFI
tara:strand:+ start:1963 stop:2079 length:117 start_codon:yes stop_codon:yes gene_type:complete